MFTNKFYYYIFNLSSTGRESIIQGKARIVGPGKLGVTFPSTFS